MLSFLVDLLGGVIGWLNTVLPTSPFKDLVDNFVIFGDALHWLNWFLPISSFVSIFLGFLAVLIAWYVIHIVLTEGIDGTKALVKG